MHCPKCFNESLLPHPRGVIILRINGMYRDTGRALFNTDKEGKKEIQDSIQAKLDEYFQWYSTFQNKKPVKDVELLSADFSCQNKCKMDVGTRFSVIGIMVSYEELEKMIKVLGEKYNIPVQLSF